MPNKRNSPQQSKRPPAEKSKQKVHNRDVPPSMRYPWYSDEGKLDAMIEALDQLPEVPPEERAPFK